MTAPTSSLRPLKSGRRGDPEPPPPFAPWIASLALAMTKALGVIARRPIGRRQTPVLSDGLWADAAIQESPGALRLLFAVTAVGLSWPCGLR
jgi:hypothetical protein